MPERQASRFGRCEICGRRVKAGRVCGKCKARNQRQLDQARAWANAQLKAVGYHGTVREMRSAVLPAMRRAAIEGLTLRQAVRLQRRMDAIMAGGAAA
jgi:transcriptional regulator with GAF, ATPase, and Fis domain